MTSSDMKKKISSVIALAMRGGVAITRHKRAEMVMLSAADYEELVRAVLEARRAPLARMTAEFDAMVGRMNTPESAAGVKALFAATPKQLGKAAVKAAAAHA